MSREISAGAVAMPWADDEKAVTAWSNWLEKTPWDEVERSDAAIGGESSETHEAVPCQKCMVFVLDTLKADLCRICGVPEDGLPMDRAALIVKWRARGGEANGEEAHQRCFISTLEEKKLAARMRIRSEANAGRWNSILKEKVRVEVAKKALADAKAAKRNGSPAGKAGGKVHSCCMAFHSASPLAADPPTARLSAASTREGREGLAREGREGLCERL